MSKAMLVGRIWTSLGPNCTGFCVECGNRGLGGSRWQDMPKGSGTSSLWRMRNVRHAKGVWDRRQSGAKRGVEGAAGHGPGASPAYPG